MKIPPAIAAIAPDGQLSPDQRRRFLIDLALRRIMAEWTSPKGLDSRILNIMNVPNPQFAARLNAGFFLIPSGAGATVQNDFAADMLFGGVDDDWFLPDENYPTIPDYHSIFWEK